MLRNTNSNGLAEMYYQWYLDEKKRAGMLHHEKRAIIKRVKMAVAEIKRFERRLDLIKKGLLDLNVAFEAKQAVRKVHEEVADESQ